MVMWDAFKCPDWSADTCEYLKLVRDSHLMENLFFFIIVTLYIVDVLYECFGNAPI